MANSIAIENLSGAQIRSNNNCGAQSSRTTLSGTSRLESRGRQNKREQTQERHCLHVIATEKKGCVLAEEIAAKEQDNNDIESEDSIGPSRQAAAGDKQRADEVAGWQQRDTMLSPCNRRNEEHQDGDSG